MEHGAWSTVLELRASEPQHGSEVRNQNLTGQHLEYDRSSGSATIFGYLVGQPVSNARVTYKDPLRGTFIPFASPAIEIEIRNGNIVGAWAKRVIGGGGT